MRVAVVGAGGMGRAWSTMLDEHDRAEIGAFVDPLVGGPGAPAWLGEHDGVPAVASVDDLRGLDLDAVVVTALTPAHADVVERALRGGLHVLVEKPFTTTLADAERLVALADAEGRTLMVSQNYRFFPGTEQVRALAERGGLGRICAVVGRFWCDWPGKPYQHAMRQPMALEMAIHHFDMARAMFDAEAVAGRVTEWNPDWSPYAAGGALEALFTMRTARANDAEGETTFPFLYSGSLVGRAPRTPWGGLWRFEFDGGTLVADEIDGTYGLFRASPDGVELLTPFMGESMMLDRSFGHFVGSVEDGTEPWPSGRDNLGTLRMALAFTDEAAPAAVAAGAEGRR